MTIRFVPAIAALTVALAPAAATAQQERTSPLPNYNLVQLSVAASAVLADEFQSRTMAITSCSEAVKLGKAMDAKVERKTFVHETSLPPQLRPVLRNLPNGMATPVLSEGGSALHVLVVCSRV
ncbi:hypothetical protein [Porphyrobacter sp. AAP60]|uniref:hypothetical protein n=1 Tax=Porphyrobacter sp. AAP60 TaxID=1523423 RepID=UPI0006B8E440|nr:hypothetical protein [Porphyrobacter sp. AAP60]KPF62242.1 hypothetical protein IP79_12955 [Porphyrobacter sp. AAP60]